MKTNKFAQQGGKTTYDISRIQAQVQANIQQAVQANLQSTASTTHSTPWRWKRTFSLALTAMLLFVVVVGVVFTVRVQDVFAGTSESPLFAPQRGSTIDQLSQEKLLEIKQAYVEHTNTKSSANEIYLEFYFGNFNGAEIVLFKDRRVKDDGKNTTIEVGDCMFYYKTSKRQIIAYFNNKVLSLQQAYEQNLILNHDVGYISHLFHTSHHLANLTSFTIDESMEQTIIQAGIEQRCASSFDKITRYYGCYDNMHVFYLLPVGETDEKCRVFYDLHFYKPSIRPILIYKEGYIYSIQEAVKKGILSKRQLLHLFSYGECTESLVDLTEQIVEDMTALYAKHQGVVMEQVEIGTIHTIIGENIVFSASIPMQDMAKWVYCRGALYSLQEAFDLGLLDNLDLHNYNCVNL